MVLAISRIEPGWFHLPYLKGYEDEALLAELPGARVLPEPGLLGRLARITELCTVDFRPLDAEEKKIIEGVLAIGTDLLSTFLGFATRRRLASQAPPGATSPIRRPKERRRMKGFFRRCLDPLAMSDC